METSTIGAFKEQRPLGPEALRNIVAVLLPISPEPERPSARPVEDVVVGDELKDAPGGYRQQ